MANQIKGDTVTVFNGQSTNVAQSDQVIDVSAYNALCLQVLVPSGCTFDLTVLGNWTDHGTFLPLPDPSATHTGVNASSDFDVLVGSPYVRLSIANISSPGAGVTVRATPYVAGGQTTVNISGGGLASNVNLANYRGNPTGPTNALDVQSAAGSQLDGHSQTIGITTDLSTTNTLVGLLKAIKAALGFGQHNMANSLPVVVASDQSAIATTVADGGSVTIGAKADTALLTGSASLIALIKGLISLIPQSLGQKTMANSLGVTIASDQSGVPIAALPAGTNLIGAEVPGASASIGTGLSTFFSTTLTNSPTAVKASAGKLHSYFFKNKSTADIWIQFFDAATGSVTLGTTPPKMSLWVPANGAIDLVNPLGWGFTTAITAAVTTTETGSTAAGTLPVVNLGYI